MEIIKLIGVLIVVVGFVLKLNTIAVVLVAGIITGLVSGLNFIQVLEILGKAFVDTRYMSLFLLSIPVIAILERNGLRISATRAISKIKGATAGRILSTYMIIRTIAAALSVRLGGHVQFIRPIVYPMIKGASEKDGNVVSTKKDDLLKSVACAVENYGNFFGQNIFVASGGVLLIVGTLAEQGVIVKPESVALASIPVGIVAVVLSIVQNILLDRNIKK